MLDFTRTLYLGMSHPKSSLRRWARLTTGLPAILGSPDEHVRVAGMLGELMGMESATLARSTLHLVFDLFGFLSNKRVALYVDSGVYPILSWGAALAASRGIPVNVFRHHDAEALGEKMSRNTLRIRQPIVVTDGWCPRCGESAPIDRYLEQARRFGGILIMDDTQALGIFGDYVKFRPGPYGKGGGGLLRRFGLTGSDIVVISSLSKAFGAPLAVLTSSAKMVSRFNANSQTRMHSSQPSAVDVLAAEHALDLNACYGEMLRQRLSGLVRRFRHRLTEIGLSAKGGLFPVQVLTPNCGINPALLYRQLYRRGIRTVLLRDNSPHKMELAFVINTRQSRCEIHFAVDALARCIRQHTTKNRKERHYGLSKLSTNS